MKTNVIITDNFYSNPDGVRSFILQQEFKQYKYPGLRTRSFLTEDTKVTIQNLIRNAGGSITNWNQED